MTLRGPADADRFRVNYRGARHYIDPLAPCELLPDPPKDDKGKPVRLPSFTAVKSLHSKTFRKKTPAGTYELTAVRAANYVVEKAEHLLELKKDGDDGGIFAAVASAPDRDLNKAGNRGTAIHLLLEAKIKGHVLDPKWVEIYAPAAIDYVEVIEDFWADQRPEAMYAEVVGLNWAHKYAFTSDVLGLKLRSYGDLILAADWKTRGPDSNHGAYMEEGMQLAAANGSEYIFVDRGDGTIVRRKPPVCDLGVVVSIKPDGVEMYDVDLDIAWEAWTEACEGWRRRKESARLGNKAVSNQPKFVQPELLVAAEEEGAAREDALLDQQVVDSPLVEGYTSSSADPFAGLPDEQGVPQIDRAAKTEHLRERFLALSPEGRQLVAGAWPDAPTFKQAREAGELHTVDQLRLIETAVAAGERATKAPFPPEDPSEPTVPADSALIQGLKERFEKLPPNRQPKPPPGIMGGRATLRQVEAFADEVSAAEELLERAVENYRKGSRTAVIADGESSNGDILKAGRAAAKALALPPPRKASDVLDDFWLRRAAS